jgi:hypothetical protein
MDVLWLIVVVYVVLVFLGRAQQKARRAGRGAGGAATEGGGPSRQERLEALRRALEQRIEPDNAQVLAARRLSATGSGRMVVKVVPQADDLGQVFEDYDSESVQAAEARLRAAEAPAVSLEEEGESASPARLAVRQPAPSVIAPRLQPRITGIGAMPADRTAAEPVPGTTAPTTARVGAARLAQLANGGLKGAFALAEILGPPKVETS